MALEQVQDLEKTLRDAIDVIKDLQSTDKADSGVMDRFQKILVMMDFSLIKMRSSNPMGKLDLTGTDDDLSEAPSLFSSIPEEIRDRLESMSRYKNFSVGDIVIKEGDVSDALYVIESGKVMIYIDSDDSMVVLSTLSNGDFFGEMALLTSKPRSATVKAMSDLVVLEIKRDDLISEIYKHPDIIRSFAGQLEIRIRNMRNYLQKK
jgi:CRP-like cAMP-binding protein